MTSLQFKFCKFHRISHAAAYNIINIRNQQSSLVYLDLRHEPATPFPSAILPPRGLSEGDCDLSIVLSCLRNCISPRCHIVLLIEEHRLNAIERDISARLNSSTDADLLSLAATRTKHCCTQIDPLFHCVPPQFLQAALGSPATRVPSLVECLLPRKLFICERKVVGRALDPCTGLGVSCVLNVTTNAAVDWAGITHSYAIEDDADADIEAVCNQTRPLLEELLGKQLTVLVHCAAGVSRSGSVVIDFVMHALHVDFHAAKALVRESRPEVRPNAAFERQLDKSPSWGIIAMGKLDYVIAKLTSQTWQPSHF